VSGASSTDSYQYTGRENDGTGLYYYRSRYYDPRQQRFVSEDPLGFVGGANFYAYVGNNPINKTDRFGLWTKQECEEKCDEAFEENVADCWRKYGGTPWYPPCRQAASEAYGECLKNCASIPGPDPNPFRNPNPSCPLPGPRPFPRPFPGLP
jgi:RHS repeat-associated protein